MERAPRAEWRSPRRHLHSVLSPEIPADRKDAQKGGKPKGQVYSFRKSDGEPIHSWDLSQRRDPRRAHGRPRRGACEAVFVVVFGQRAAFFPCPCSCARLRPPLLAPKPREVGAELIPPAPPGHHENDGACRRNKCCRCFPCHEPFHWTWIRVRV
jgi:hypothetical protein